MSSIREFIYLETAFRCVNCSGRLTKYKDELDNIYYVCNSCNSKYFATKKPKTRYVIDIGVMFLILLFFIYKNTDKFSVFDYISAWFILVGFFAFIMIFITFVSHYVFDEINLIENIKNKPKRKFTGSLVDFLLRRHQTICPICNARHALVNKKGKDSRIYYHCVACEKLFIENKKFNIFSVSYLLVMGILFLILTYFTKSLWLLLVFILIFFLYYVIIWLLYKYKDIEFYNQMSAAERNKKLF